MKQVSESSTKYKPDVPSPEQVKPRLSGNKKGLARALEAFVAEIKEIPEVEQVLLTSENGNPNVYVVFISKELNTRLSIYHIARETLFSMSEVDLDLHTVNLADFPVEQWETIIPSGLTCILKKSH